ncbi:hypothetical protein Tco_0843113 [Tanacetum coccineum]|uniref:Uncharacterized protein n=1 Tax=Tanacetum coccineum TaxID=301880 RepID=A0ABQ5B219_9ASTR
MASANVKKSSRASPKLVKHKFKAVIAKSESLHRPQVISLQLFKAPDPQTHGVSKTDFEDYVTANDAVLRNNAEPRSKLQCPNGKFGTDMLSNLLQIANYSCLLRFWELFLGNTVTNQRRFKRGSLPEVVVTIKGPKTV